MSVLRITAGIVLALVAIVCFAGPHRYCTRPQLRCSLAERDYAYKNFAPPVTSMSLGPVPLALAESFPPNVQPATSSSPFRPPADLIVPSLLDANSRKLAVGNLQTPLLPPPFLTPPGFNYPPPPGASARGPALVPQAQLFQFVEPPLQINHCSLSNPAVQVYPDGTWILTLQADQNPLYVAPLRVRPNVVTAEPVVQYTANLLRNEFYIRLHFYGQSNVPVTPSGAGRPVLAAVDVPPFWVERGIPYRLNSVARTLAIQNVFPYIDRVMIEFTYRLASFERPPVP